MKQIIDGLQYDTETATLITSDHYWDGRNFERDGRNKFLYKTKRGNFFVYHTTRWQGEIDWIEPVSETQARNIFEKLPNVKVDYEAAFNERPELT